MTEIVRYYNLLFDLEESDYRIGMFTKDSNSRFELQKEREKNQSLKQEIFELKAFLSNNQNRLDDIRTAMIHVANEYLNAFSNIEKWGNYFPDLSQGMVIPGYLFGMIINDFKTSLTTEGSYYPNCHIYMSQKEWPVRDLKNRLSLLKTELMSFELHSKMDLINYYEKIKSDLNDELRILRELGILYQQ